MTDTAVHSLQISGSSSRIMRLVIHCYRNTEETQEETYNWVCPSKNTAKGDLIVPARRRLSPKHEGGLGALLPLGSPREEFIPASGYSTQELHMKKQISSRGNFFLLECLPYNPILWATCFGNAAVRTLAETKGKWFLSEDCRKPGHNLTLTAAFCSATSVLS